MILQEDQMSDSSEDDLPDVTVSLKRPEVPLKTNKKQPYHIDLSREIQLTQLNYKIEKSRIKVAEEEKLLCTVDTNYEKHQQEVLDSLSKIDTIPDEAPGREFIETGTSFRQINAATLVKPSRIKQANLQDFLVFQQYVRSVLLEITVRGTAGSEPQEVLEYILLLASVHQNEYLVECCTDLLLEFNAQWKINHKSLLAIFQNWGADISQVLPCYDPAPARITNNKAETVPEHNVTAVLLVLHTQLKLGKRTDRFNVAYIDEVCLWNIDELVFGLLILLGLDAKFINCFPALQDCVCELLNGVSKRNGPNWVSEYSETLIYLETDDYNLTSIVCRILFGSSACEALRLSVSFAGIQRILGTPPNKISHTFELPVLKSLLSSTTKLATLEPLNIYCILIFVDTIIRDPQVSNEATFRYFYKWLMRLDCHIDRKPHIIALISTYGTLWDEEANPVE